VSGPVQEAEDRSPRPSGHLGDLLRGVAFDDREVDRFPLLGAERGEGAVELTVAQIVGSFPSFGCELCLDELSVTLALEWLKKYFLVAAVTVDEAIADRGE